MQLKSRGVMGIFITFMQYNFTDCILALIRHINEKDLLLRVAGGDEKAFEELFYAYHNQLGAYVMGWTKSIAIAEEIVQDVFLKIWMNRQALPSVDRFDNYLYILSRNFQFNSLRKIANNRFKSREWAKNFENDQDFSPDTVAEEYLPLIEQTIATLPPQQQKVYILKRRQDLKYEEIASQLNISPETARKHLAAALKNITAYVKEHLPLVLVILSSRGY